MGYPALLFDDILSFSSEPRPKRALLIGWAMGPASMSLAQRGLELTCIEPDVNLGEFARRNLPPTLT
jgi:hypothetical protein